MTDDFDFKHTWVAPQTFRAQSVIGSYALSNVKLEKRIKGSLPLEGWPWQVGIIVGSSGSGKTSIAKRIVYCPSCGFVTMRDESVDVFLCSKCLDKGVEVRMESGYIKGFDYSQPCFLNDFPENLPNPEIEKALSSTGFSEPPSWLKSYSVLSQGQKMRVDIARALLLDKPLIVFDEFTSVVDREVAKVGALAISRAVRRTKKQFIAVTCHFDVIDWLEPDWVVNADTMDVVKKNDPTQQLSSRFIVAVYPCGRSFGSIII
jgi:ABC-type ATPase with predicted acetyltransferase domain